MKNGDKMRFVPEPEVFSIHPEMAGRSMDTLEKKVDFLLELIGVLDISLDLTQLPGAREFARKYADVFVPIENAGTRDRTINT